MKRTVCFLLIAILAGFAKAATENFTTWSETDSGGYLTPSTSSVVATNVPRSQICYLSKDYGSSYWDDDFSVRFQFVPGAVSHTDTSSFLGLCAFTTAASNWYHLSVNGGAGVTPVYSRDTTGYKLFLWMVKSGSEWYAFSDNIYVSVGTTYYITFSRDYDGGTYEKGLYTLTVCTGNYQGLSGSSLVGSKTLDAPSAAVQDFRYVLTGLSKLNGGVQTASGTLANMELTEIEPPAGNVYYIYPGESVNKYSTGMQPDDIIEFQAAVPGGTVTFKGCLVMGSSGTAGHPITYRARAGDTVIIDGFTGSVQDKRSLDTASCSWVTIKGFTLTNSRTSDDDYYWVWLHKVESKIVEGIVIEDLMIDGGGILVQLIDGVTIRNCTVANAPIGGIVLLGSANYPLGNSLIEGCTIYGYATDAITLHEDDYYNSLGARHVIKDCTVYGGKSGSENAYDLTSGSHIIMTNCTARDCPQPAVLVGGYHDNNTTQWVRIENCRFYDNGAYSEHIFLHGKNTDYVQIVGNVFYGGGEHCVRSSSEYTPGVRHVRLFHNVFDATGLNETPTYGVQFQEKIDDVALRNNAFLLNGDVGIYWQPNPADSDMQSNYNLYHDLTTAPSTALWYYGANRALAYIQGTISREGDAVESDPCFANRVTHDYTLLLDSDAIDAGGWLTTITTGNGSGTSFAVADPNWLYDGWGTAQTGDLIQLQGQSITATITDVNYTTKTITVDKSLTWTQGLGIGLAYSGQAPDIGAYESAGEYSEDPNALMDFTDGWIEVDPGSDIAITDANTITVTTMPSNISSYLYKDFGSAFFAGDLLIRERITVTASGNLGFFGALCLSNAPKDYQNMLWGGDDGILVYWRQVGGVQTLYLNVLVDGTPHTDSMTGTLSTEYFLTLSRDYDGGTYGAGLVTLRVCTGAYYGYGGSLVGTLTVNVPTGGAQNFSHALVAQSMTNQGSNTVSGTITYLEMGATGSGQQPEPDEEETPDEGVPGPAGHGPYYVSPYGNNDANGCTQATPWRTLAYALDTGVTHGTESYNVIYLMAGNHGGIALSTKTWDSTDWSSEWLIEGMTGAELTGLAITGVAAFLDFNDITIRRPNPDGGTAITIQNAQSVRIRNIDIQGTWATPRELMTFRGVALIGDTGAGYVQDVNVSYVTIRDTHRAIHLIGDIRNDVIVDHCVGHRLNEDFIYLGDFPATRNNYDAIEIFYNTYVDHPDENISHTTAGPPHGTALTFRGDNVHVKGHVGVAISGSGAVRFYEAYGPYDDITIEDSIFISPTSGTTDGGYAELAGFYQICTNVVIRNNTFISGHSYSTGIPTAYRYAGTLYLRPHANYDNSLIFKNNIIVGRVDSGSMTLEGGNNMMFASYRNGVWSNSWDTNDVIVCQNLNTIASGYTANWFEQVGNVFIGSPTFSQWFTNHVTPTTWQDFALPSSSPAVDAGQPSEGSEYDVRGLERDASPDIGAFEYISASAPLKPTNPMPANAATNVSLSTVLHWAGTADNWDVYIGTAPTALVKQDNVQARDYIYSWAYSTTYYWRIDANNATGLTTGDVWTFTTVAQTVDLPPAASNPQPANGAGNQPTSRTLYWTGSSLAIGYNVYFGTADLDLLTSTGSTSAAVSGLTANTTYMWRVDTVGVNGTTTGPVWLFTTYNPSQPGDPGTPGSSILPQLPMRTRTPLNQAARTGSETSRPRVPYQGLFCYELEGRLPGSYATDENLSGYLRRLVVIPTGTDTEWSLTITDAFGGPMFTDSELDMTEGVVAYDYDGPGIPFVGGLVAIIAGTTGDTTEEIRIELLIDETWRR